MRDTAKLAIRLMVFALASALLLAMVNALTKDTIAENERAIVNAARQSVLGEYEFKQVDTDLTDYPDIIGVYAGYDGDQIMGYVYELKSKGFAGMVSMSLGIDASGAITGVNVTNHKETKGLGSADEKPFLASFVGLNAAYESDGAGATANEGASSDIAGTAIEGVDGMTGATYSSNAVKNGAAEALRHFAANFLNQEVSAQ